MSGATSAAVALGSSMLAPAAGGALASGLGLEAVSPMLMSAIAGAGMNGIGSLLTGQDPLKGALMGGIGGGIGSAVSGAGGLSGLFDSGANAAAEMGSEGAGSAADSLTQGASEGMYPTSVQGASSPSFFSSGIGKFLPYAAAGALPLLAGNNNAPVGPPMRQPLQSKPVLPGNRQMQSVDPNSYLTSGGNRSFFSDINPQLQYAPPGYAKGGSVGIGGGILVNSANKNPTPYPVTGKKRGVTRYYANGGSSSAGSSNIPAMGMISGSGDGQSDSIPAKLSDGEFVVSAPVVSALGNGSNDAGAKKLAKMQKGVIARHYSGGKPKKSLGLGSYVH